MVDIFYLLDASENASTLYSADLWMQYAIYGAIIVVGLILLGVIRRSSRLPSHENLLQQLTSLSEGISKLIDAQTTQGAQTGYDFIKETANLMYRTDKLIYVTTLLSSKERDGDIGNISIALESVRAGLSAYKFKIGAQDDLNGLYAAKEKADAAVTTIKKILKRDSDMKTKK